MNKSGPILIVEDDKDDREILSEVFKKLGYRNKVKYFSDGNEALNFLIEYDEVPFIIMSDINMPKLNGMELRDIIQKNEELRMKCVPFIFFTTSTTKKSVTDAYAFSVQGFFIKPNSFKELEQIIRKVMEYWIDCKSPSDYI